MKWSIVLSFVLSIGTTFARHRPDYDAHDYYAIHLRPGVNPEDVSKHLSLHYDGPLGELEDHYIFHTDVRRADHDHVRSAIEELKLRRKKREDGAEQSHVLDHVLLSQKQELHKRFPLVKREADAPDFVNTIPGAQDSAVNKMMEIAGNLSITDPIFPEQWHLFNPVQIGHDINVTGVWLQGVTGKNSTVCFVDDGLDMDSDDLRDNYFAAGSYDFNDHVSDPKPRLADDRHGTRCAGEVGAVKNDVCGVGIAYDGRVSGLRILSSIISDADEAEAMTYAYQENQIYSCSWGPPDDGQSMEAPGLLIQRSMLTGIQKGRAGLGSIYVFAIGNGAANDDNCNFDGYTNSIYSVSVGGISRSGKHPYYSEKCSAQLVVTYSSGDGDAIHTTDVGKNACSTSHGGTSAAGPLVAGMYALMLEVNPSLTWRDIQWITVLTAVKLNEGEGEWHMNEAIGREFSHQFGYGKADAYALVEMAREWTNVKPQSWYFSPWLPVNHDIPQGEKGLSSTYKVTQKMVEEANLERLEHVTVTMNVNHTRRGDLSVELRSPSGMVSHIATHRRNDNANYGYEDWTFMSVAHWGESGVGDWTVVVKDTNVNEFNGTFIDWRLKLWGEAIYGSQTTLLPMPTYEDDDHTYTETASVGTLSVAVPTETGLPAGNPTDHIDRPVNMKTSDVSSPTPMATSSISRSTTSKTQPTSRPPTDDDKLDSESSATSTPLPSNFLPRPFPTFGVSKTTQIWIYGAFVLILIFLAVLGAWCLYMRRKKRWMNRGDYGFEMIDHDEDDDATGANGQSMTGVRRKKRAVELYDAFAEGSDEEHMDEDDDDAEPFDLGEDSEDEINEKRYRDDDPRREGVDVS